MAFAIVGEIQIKLTPEEEVRLTSARQVDPEAYEAYLKGLSHWYKLTPPDLEAAIQYFESALKIDPNYALAHTGIALVWIGRQQMGIVAPNEATPKAKDAALKALELDNTLAEVHYTLALIRTWSDWAWEAGESSSTLLGHTSFVSCAVIEGPPYRSNIINEKIDTIVHLIYIVH